MNSIIQETYKMGMRALSLFRIKRIWHWKTRLEKEQYYDRNQLKALQRLRARELVESLLKNCYYKSIWPETKCENDRWLEFLSKFPVLTREDVRDQYFKGLLSVGERRNAQLDSTSGSTGIPLRFAKDRRTEALKLATEILFSEYTGWKFGQKQLSLWAEHEESFLSRIWNLVFMRRCRLPPYYNTERGWNWALYTIREFNPRLVTGYSSALYSFANHFRNESGLLERELAGIIASAEALYPHQKKIVEDVLGSRVFMRYGTRELDNIGMECKEHNGYHILESRYIVEILDNNGKEVSEGDTGRIVVTDLMNRVFPFVRYDTGDEGSVTSDACECGRRTMRLEEIRGRQCDYVEMPSGGKVPFLRFNVLFEQMGGVIGEFQVEQESISSIVIRVVPDTRYSTKISRTELKQLTKSILPREISVRIEIVEEIPRTQSGKFRYIIPLTKS